MEYQEFGVVARHEGYSTGVHRVHISIESIGMFIMGMTVRVSIKPDMKWWVQPPAHKAKNFKYYKDFNFDHSSKLWKEIEFACINCVEEYLFNETITDLDIAKNLDKVLPD